MLAYTLDWISDYLANPNALDFLISLVVGVLLAWFAIRMAGAESGETTEPKSRLTPLSAFGIGILVNFVGMPFALPYLAAIGDLAGPVGARRLRWGASVSDITAATPAAPDAVVCMPCCASVGRQSRTS